TSEDRSELASHQPRTKDANSHTAPSSIRQRKDAHRFGEAPHGDIPDGDEFRLGQRLRCGSGKKERGAVFLAERLEPRGQVHRVAMDRVALAPAAADIAGKQRARINADAHAN